MIVENRKQRLRSRAAAIGVVIQPPVRPVVDQAIIAVGGMGAEPQFVCRDGGADALEDVVIETDLVEGMAEVADMIGIGAGVQRAVEEEGVSAALADHNVIAAFAVKNIDGRVSNERV